MSPQPSMSREELLALPAVVDLVTAGRAWGLSRGQAYALHQAGQFPCEVRQIGKRYRVVTESLLASLDIVREAGQEPGGIPS